MLWLIQRDFLQGKSVQAMVTEALAEVPNPAGNPDIAQVPSKSSHASLPPGAAAAARRS
jgi:hypothetical protein